MIDAANMRRIELRIKRLVSEGKIASAQADRSPEGRDAEERLDAKHESAVANGDAPKE